MDCKWSMEEPPGSPGRRFFVQQAQPAAASVQRCSLQPIQPTAHNSPAQPSPACPSRTTTLRLPSLPFQWIRRRLQQLPCSTEQYGPTPTCTSTVLCSGSSLAYGARPPRDRTRNTARWCQETFCRASLGVAWRALCALLPGKLPEFNLRLLRDPPPKTRSRARTRTRLLFHKYEYSMYHGRTSHRVVRMTFESTLSLLSLSLSALCSPLTFSPSVQCSAVKPRRVGVFCSRSWRRAARQVIRFSTDRDTSCAWAV